MEEQIKELQHLLLESSPILFLGAGFSLGAKRKDGSNLENANELKKAIIEEFILLDKSSAEFKEVSSYDLPKVSEYAEGETSRASFIDFLTQRFKDLNPADYHYALRKYPWRKIYTTNIDDILETVYRGDKEHKLLVQNEKKGKIPHKEDTNVIEYYKLHGCVNNPADGYIFTSSSYVQYTVKNLDYRLNSLAIDIQKENLIFVGSNFEEADIDYYLKLYEEAGYSSQKGGLVFINPKPSLLLAKRVQKLNGLIIRWSTQQFLEYVDNLNYTENKNKRTTRILLLNGFNRFDQIKAAYRPLRHYNSKLYEGYEPKWEDVFAEWDFRNPITNNILNEIDHYKTFTGKTHCVVVTGKSYIGKTCILKRIASDLNQNGFEVFEFVGRYFNLSPLKEYINNSRTKNHFALIIDNASFYYHLIEKLLVSELAPDKVLVIVCTSRPYYHQKRRYYLVGNSFSEFNIPEKISPEFAENIISKLEGKGLEGDLKRLKSKSDKVRYLRKGSDLMTALLSINYGLGFERRIAYDLNKFISHQGDGIQTQLLFDLVIFDKAEIPYFPLEIITMLYSTGVDKLLLNVDTFVKSSREGISIRNGFLSDRLYRTMKKPDIIKSISEILIVVSPQVSETRTNYWKIIFESLVKVDILHERFGLSSRQIKHLLHDLRNYYGEISYYWLQLGLAEQKDKDFAKALNHFKQAESIKPVAYHIQHAIGRNYLKEANSLSNLMVAETVFKQGEKMLKKLIEIDSLYQFRAFSIHSFLSEKIEFFKRFKISPSNNELKTMMTYLKVMVQKDKEDEMTKRIFKKFYLYLKSIRKTNIISFDGDIDFYLSSIPNTFAFVDDDMLDVL